MIDRAPECHIYFDDRASWTHQARPPSVARAAWSPPSDRRLPLAARCADVGAVARRPVRSTWRSRRRSTTRAAGSSTTSAGVPCRDARSLYAVCSWRRARRARPRRGALLERAASRCGTPARCKRGATSTGCRSGAHSRPAPGASITWISTARCTGSVARRGAARAALRVAGRRRVLVLGRTAKAHRSHHEPLWATEVLANRLIATRLDLARPLDLLVPSFVAERELAARLLEVLAGPRRGGLWRMGGRRAGARGRGRLPRMPRARLGDAGLPPPRRAPRRPRGMAATAGDTRRMGPPGRRRRPPFSAASSGR